ncbi:MAG: GMC oxidoreductase, partial [Caulobacteraceae bacterium]
IPKGSTVEDWPLTLEELEPYYDKVEYEVGVSGKAGNIGGRIDPAGNIFEGARAREYPMPALHGTEFTQMMADAAKGLGLHAFPGPAAVNSVAREGRSPCLYHGWCDRGGCHVSAKGSTNVSTIPKALATKRLQVTTGANVISIDVGKEGRVQSVTYLKGGETYVQPAEAVILASYVYENVRLLLLSKSRQFPKGLANNHGQVGRHYMSHAQFDGVTALFPQNINNWYGLPAQGTAVDNFADDNFDHAGLDFIGGGSMYVYSNRRPIAAASMGTFGKTQRSWGAEWKRFVAENADRTNTAYLQKTTLPYEDNVLDLDPVVKDPLGQPVIRITADYKDNEKRIGAFVQEKMAAWYRAAGAIAIDKAPVGTMGPTTHAYGGARMGHNPQTNVVDQWGFCHEVQNLGIVGGSVMGTSGSRNPTLTAQALAWRTAQHLAENWKSRTA